MIPQCSDSVSLLLAPVSIYPTVHIAKIMKIINFSVALASAGNVKRRVAAKDNEVSAGGHFEAIAIDDGGHGGYGGGGGGKGFSAGSGLKTIAQGSAEQANNAVANQHVAARQAAFAAKSSLAQAAANVSSIYMKYKQIANNGVIRHLVQ